MNKASELSHSKLSSAPPPIEGASSEVAAFVGLTERGSYRPQLVTSVEQFATLYGRQTALDTGFLPHAVRGFFANGGRFAYVARVGATGKSPVPAAEFIGNRKVRAEQRHGLAALMDISDISMLALPDLVHPRVSFKTRETVLAAAVAQCVTRHDRMIFLDPPSGAADLGEDDPIIGGIDTSYAAIYGPWLELKTDGGLVAVPPSGHVAGVYARNDRERAVWHAPAGTRAEVRGIDGVTATLSESERAALAQQGINVIQDFRRVKQGIVLWGARTHCADAHWKYVALRRLAMYIEASILDGTQWAMSEPNGQALWSRLRQAVAEFLGELRHKRALQGIKPEEAFYVRCDPSTMTTSDIKKGLAVCQIGFAPLRPSEFVELRVAVPSRDAHRRKSAKAVEAAADD
ncbi:MAG: phage tail sheath family protein [Deltaproteobacteria bacterium]|nr:phage tail sheath family protein [Deltaproteobacteria bacterium]